MCYFATIRYGNWETSTTINADASPWIPLATSATITYVPLDITEKLLFKFDENALLRLS